MAFQPTLVSEKAPAPITHSGGSNPGQYMVHSVSYPITTATTAAAPCPYRHQMLDFIQPSSFVTFNIQSIRFSIKLLDTDIKELLSQSQDPTKNSITDITTKLDVLSTKAKDLFGKSVDILYQNRHLHDAYDLFKEAEKIHTKLKGSIAVIYNNIKLNQQSELDIQDIQSNISIPQFDGKTLATSLNIYQYIEKIERFFVKRNTKNNMKSIYIKNYILSPAKDYIWHVIKDEDNFEEIKSILIRHFGKWSNMCQELSFMHQNVGSIPSTKGNNIPWLSIQRKVKDHLSLLHKAKSIGDSFVNHYTYLSMIMKYLPLDIDIDEDSTFNDVKQIYIDIERQASIMTEYYDDDNDDNNDIHLHDIDTYASYFT